MSNRRKTIMKVAVLIGIVILPLIYSITYLKGFWDPYNNLGDIKVAVVNEDACKNNCKSKDLIDKLKDSDSFDFVVKDSKDAEDGLHSKKYYAIIKIPSDFTSSFDNAESKDRSSTTITYRPNNKTNYIASQLINNAVMQVEMKLDKEVSKEVVSKLTDKLDSVPNQLSSLSNGLGTIANGTTLLDNGVQRLKIGTSELNSKYTLFNDGVQQLNSGLEQAKEGTDELSSNSSKIKDGISTLNSALDQLYQGTNELNDATSSLSTLVEGVSSLKNGSTLFSDSLGEYKDASDGVLDNVQGFYESISNYCDANAELQANDANFKGLCLTAKGYLSADAFNTLKGKTAALKSTYDNQIDSGIGTINSKVSSLGLLSNKIDLLNSSVGLLKTKVSELNNSYILFDNGVQKLNGASDQLINGANTLVNSSSQVKDGISTLDSSVNTLKSGTSSLDSGVKTAKSQVDDKISSTDEQLSALDGLDEYTSNPVEVKQDAYGDVNDYGTFFSPFFMSLSLWLGGILILIGLYYDPDNRFEILGRHSKNRPLRLVYYVLIGIIQAIVLGVTLKLALGFEVTNWFLFFGSCILISIAFLSIMMFLVFNFGDIGKFIAIVWLVVQLAACGGTFPLEVEPHFFKDISPFMPMTYSVELLRESFVSVEHSLLYKDLAVLIGILVVFSGLVFVTGYIKTKKQEDLQNKKSSKKIKTINKKLKSSK